MWQRARKRHGVTLLFLSRVDYFYNVDKYPDEDARAELAERVRNVPGCEHYTARQVYAYFGNMRFKTREGHIPKAMRRLRPEDGSLPGERLQGTFYNSGQAVRVW